jgi:hypothetical protein
MEAYFFGIVVVYTEEEPGNQFAGSPTTHSTSYNT